VTVDPRSRIYHLDWLENYPTRSAPIYYDVRNMLYMLMKFKPKEFRRSGLLMVKFRRNAYYFLIASIFTYLAGNEELSSAFYLAVKDVYDCRMHKCDLYKRIGFRRDFDPEELKKKQILVPMEPTGPEQRRFMEFVDELEDCEIVMDAGRPRLGKLIRAFTSWRKYDYVFISNKKMNILYPMLGKRKIKMEDNGLHTYKFSYLKVIKLILACKMLGVKMMIRRLIGFRRWREKLMWRQDKI
jgi:hypothetical protein